MTTTCSLHGRYDGNYWSHCPQCLVNASFLLEPNRDRERKRNTATAIRARVTTALNGGGDGVGGAHGG